MEPEEQQPLFDQDAPAETPDKVEDIWASYEHILETEPGSVAVYGLQMVVFMDQEGRQHTRWCVDGDPEPDLLIGTLDRIKFFIHVQNLDMTIAELEEDDETED